MDTMSAALRGLANRGQPVKVFDWDNAARLIKEQQPQQAAAGLAGDWESTGGTIWEDDKPVIGRGTYLSSNWAMPELEMDGLRCDCYVMESETEWDSDTSWPETARAIVLAEET